MNRGHADQLGKEDKIVVQALRTAGLRIKSVYDLVNTKASYPEAIPVLINMLPKVHHDRIKEGIARALTVQEARPIAAQALVREFLRMPSDTESQEHTKWAIGNALSVVADDSVFGDIATLISDKRHGSARAMLLHALCNMREHREQAVHLLMDSLADDKIGVQAMIALGKLRVKKARVGIERFLKDLDPWVRQEAKRALAKIDKMS